MQSFSGKFYQISSLPRSWMLMGYILPMSLACAGIAGLPMVMGVVSVLAAWFCCLILGERTEALMVLTPYSTLVLSAAIAFYRGVLAEQTAVASLLTLFTGIWLLLLSMVFPRKRMNWIARPVWHGICLGIIATLGMLMVPLMLGVTPDGSFWPSFWTAVLQWQNWNWPSVVLALISIMLFLIWRPAHQPKALWLIVLMWIIDQIWPFNVLGVATSMQQQWQLWPLLKVAHPDWLSIIFMSASVALLIFVEICQHQASRMQHCFVMASISNMMSALLGGMVVGLCRFSGRVYKIDRRTLLITLLLLIYVYYFSWSFEVPLPVLAVIVLYMMYKQFSWSELRLYKRQWADLVLLYLTAFLIFSLGVLSGLWLVMTFSLIFMWWRLLREHAWPLLPANVQIITGAIVITMPQVLLFANARFLLYQVGNLAKELPQQDVYVDVSKGCRIDITVLIYLQSLARRMHWHGKKLFICGLTEQNLKTLTVKSLDYLPSEQLCSSRAVHLLHIN